MAKKIFIIGIDEVGRGCLAGPVVVAALALPGKLRIKNYESGKLKDSKKLSAKQREEWFAWIKNQEIPFAAASVYPKVIDRVNISQAANLAATRALRKIIESLSQKSLSLAKVYLDGGLFLESGSKNYKLWRKARTIIKGDEKYNCIKLASIVAKVKRDKTMARRHKEFPRYGFNQHVGYGTKAHISAIKKHGPCQLHRLTFLKNFYIIKSEARNPI